MGICKDPRLTYLNEQGYNVIRLPRKGITPLGVLGRDHRAKNWLGTLDQIWQSDIAPPKPGDPQPVSTLKGTKTSELKLSVGLDILANALSGMLGGSAPSLDAAYQGAKSVQFSFQDVRSVGIDPFVVGNFLAKGDLADRNPLIKRYFSNVKDVDALVITEVLEAKSVGVIAKKDATKALAVDVPNIKAVLGAKVEVSATDSSNVEVKYEGPDYLVFGFKAFGIGMLNGEWQIYGVAPSEEGSFAVGADIGKPFVETAQLVDIDIEPRPLGMM
ncbi:MAG: hypothetical protein ABI647_05685 [Gemmatimonadota bacterium]